MKKPIEIFNLEKAYGIKLEIVFSEEDILDFNKKNNSYLMKRGKIIGLSLVGNRISSIKELENFTDLKLLNLSQNSINVLERLDNFKTLEILYLADNKIVKIEASNNWPLKTLNLIDNKITNVKGLEKLFNLERLYLNNNQIKIIDNLENIKHLKILDLSFNHLSEIDFSLFDKLDLHSLNIRNNWINKFKNVHFLREIKKINLAYNQIEDIDSIQKIIKLETLDYINVEGNPFLNDIILKLNTCGYENHLEDLKTFFNFQY